MIAMPLLLRQTEIRSIIKPPSAIIQKSLLWQQVKVLFANILLDKLDTMGNRLSKIYTRTGDDGTTGLAANTRLPKDAACIEAMGDVDELNSTLGLLLTQALPDEARKLLTAIQHRLFDLGGELAMPEYQVIRASDTVALETAIDDWNASLPPLKEFILPGGSAAAAQCHLARTVCRRAERRLVHLHHIAPLRPEVLHYINRLSDTLFVLARTLNREAAMEVVYWQKPT
jgi:ATP:cob(I)alamin adenosyltransferase